MRISDWSSDVCSSDLRIDDRRRLGGFIIERAGADRIARGIVAKGGGGRLARIVIGLAEREMKVQPVVVARAIGGVRAAQRRLHRRAFVGAETDRLQIGEAPPQFAEPRIGGKRVAIGGDALLLPPHRLQHMAIAHPQLGVRSEEHTSELQSLMRISYAVFCLKKKKIKINTATI